MFLRSSPFCLPLYADDVFLGSSALCGSTLLQVDVNTATLNSFTVFGSNALCATLNSVFVLDGKKLTSANFTLSGGALRFNGTGTVVATSKFEQSDASLITGTGVVNSPFSVLRGYVSPGTVASSCSLCTNPWVTDSLTSANVGSISFVGAQTSVIGATIFVKAFANAADSLAFVNLAFLGAVSNIWIYADTGVTVFAPVSYVTLQNTVPPVVTTEAFGVPWLAACQADCSGQKAPPLGPPGGAPTLCGSSSGASSLSVIVAPAGGDCINVQAALCNPTCLRGTCGSGGFCLCPASGNGFAWSGAACDVAICPQSCNGAVAGTCSGASSSAMFPSCVCNAPFSGQFCTSLTCSPSCANGGVCELGVGTATTCNCLPGFSGVDCSTIVGASVCPPCGAHGACGGSASNYTCVCNTGWRGSQCQIPICPGYVQGANVNCNNNGVCNSGVCACASGWSGLDCSIRVCPTNGYCLNGGVCSVSNVTGTDPTCACPPNWTGTFCSISRTGNGTPAWVIAVAVALPVLVVGATVAAAIMLYRWRSNTLHSVRIQQEQLTKFREEVKDN